MRGHAGGMESSTDADVAAGKSVGGAVGSSSGGHPLDSDSPDSFSLDGGGQLSIVQPISGGGGSGSGGRGGMPPGQLLTALGGGAKTRAGQVKPLHHKSQVLGPEP
jgi:hypothetical protein